MRTRSRASKEARSSPRYNRCAVLHPTRMFKLSNKNGYKHGFQLRLLIGLITDPYSGFKALRPGLWPLWSPHKRGFGVTSGLLPDPVGSICFCLSQKQGPSKKRLVHQLGWTKTKSTSWDGRNPLNKPLTNWCLTWILSIRSMAPGWKNIAHSPFQVGKERGPNQTELDFFIYQPTQLCLC